MNNYFESAKIQKTDGKRDVFLDFLLFCTQIFVSLALMYLFCTRKCQEK